MDLSNITDDEILYRVVKKSYPDAFVNGKATAALFIDEGGASVDRDGGRDESVIVEKLIERFARRDDYRTSVKISAGKCREIGTYPNPTGNKKNIYHAEIHDSETEIQISVLKAMQLAEQCNEVVLEKAT